MSRFRQPGVAVEQVLAGRRMHVADYLRQWLEDRENLKASTRRSYAEHIDLYLVPYLGHLRLEELAGEDLRAMYKAMREPRRRKPKCGEAHAWRLAPAHLAATRGLRRGEIIALRWEDVDLDDGVLEINHNIVQLGYATEEGTPKSDASQREIVLDDDNLEVLKAHRAQQRRERVAHGPAYLDHGLVFAKEDGSPSHPELSRGTSTF